jgi:hypothetical protein
MTGRTSHWSQHARQWGLIGAPLRPSAEDIRRLETEIAGWQVHTAVGAPRALLCGVTPEVARLNWPAGTRLTAIDHSMRMINGVWPAGEVPGRAVCADWLAMPLARASQHLLVGDGSHCQMVGRVRYAAFNAELRRVAADNALVAMRHFLRPESGESVGRIFDDLRQKRIGNFHVFKWRLAMALHGPLEQGVRLGDVWETWHQLVPDPQPLATDLDWPLEVINTIENYRDVDTRYTFPTLDEVRALSVDFTITGIHVPVYEIGDRCPTLVMRPQ